MPDLRTYTVVDEEECIVVCNDCGASTTMGHELLVEHYPCCIPGEAERWEGYYENTAEEWD